jgi:hypothetical protein
MSFQVRELIEAFISSPKLEVYLPADLDSNLRKYAHSLAEKSGLVHTTKTNEGKTEEDKIISWRIIISSFQPLDINACGSPSIARKPRLKLGQCLTSLQ